MAKEIKYGVEARKALESGVNQLADTVRARTHLYFELQVQESSAAYSEKLPT